jgi:hypothetical protein
LKKSKRNVVVFAGLLGVLTGTSCLLLFLAPKPLDPTSTMMSVEAQSGVTAGRWSYIYLHHAKDQPTIGDHFVVAADGSVSATDRWAKQEPAAAPPGAQQINPACVSICLAGDCDHRVPTAAQLAGARALVLDLERSCGITPERLILLPQRNSPVGVGKLFPTESFRKSCLP